MCEKMLMVVLVEIEQEVRAEERKEYFKFYMSEVFLK